MIRIIENRLYCITSYTGHKTFVECENENELSEYIAGQDVKWYTVSSVTEICSDGSKPRVAIKANATYKRIIKDFLRRETK